MKQLVKNTGKTETRFHPDLVPDSRIRMDGLEFLKKVHDLSTPAVFFDPQYRGVLERLSYGNEGKSRGSRRSSLEQMQEPVILGFIQEIHRILVPSGHLFLWVDKFHLCSGIHPWLEDTSLEIVDMLTWDKQSFGMGYRTRRRAEYCVVLQKAPKRAKGVWTDHGITDVWPEKASQKEHPHAKPVGLQARLIEAVTQPGDLVVDPAAGSFSVLKAATDRNRLFLGCDLKG